jgi:IS30 family transposase
LATDSKVIAGRLDIRGALKTELLQHLRRYRAMRRSRSHTQKTPDHGRITNTVSISERSPSVEDRAVPGHWEGDLVFGSNNSQIATLVERQTRYVMMTKVVSKDTETVINATLATDIKVYFCDPQNPWQRGSNENTNGLLRQYFPKGTDLSVHSQAKLNAVARQLNERPRKTLNFETPAKRFGQCVASID